MPPKQLILGTSFLLIALGFLLALWPLSVLGVALAAASGSWFAAIFFGLLLDVAYGAPTGWFHAVPFPFALCAVLFFLLRMTVLHYMRRGTQKTL